MSTEKDSETVTQPGRPPLSVVNCSCKQLVLVCISQVSGDCNLDRCVSHP